MSVNQRIADSLKHGDKKRIGDLIGTTSQNVSNKFKPGAPEINSYEFLKAVSKVTGKPIVYFTEGKESEEENDPITTSILHDKPCKECHDKLVMENEKLKNDLIELGKKFAFLTEKYYQLITESLMTNNNKTDRSKTK